ncbi:MAG: DUF4251 domain-containing protein, partial [Bacteroidaceae bacterium]|nr:DUF4251 domain-containing protein [Bacteroidaceae bacterium]
MRKILMTILAVAALSSCTLSKEAAAARQAEKVQEESELNAALDKREFVVDINRIIPQTMSPDNVVGYDVTIKGDTLFSHLPYRGRAYDLPYGGGVGLNFTHPIGNYKDQKARGNRVIVVNVKNEEDTYTYTFEISSDGFTRLS